jgi:hypothetical protein
MYWELVGSTVQPALSDRVEELAKWVQWAMYSTTQGASANEDVIRYNLNQFWAEKDKALPLAQSEDEKRQIYRLDMMSHGILNAVDSGKLYSVSPSYWDFWKSYVFGGTPPRETAGVQAEAKQAAVDAAAAAEKAGLPTFATYFSNVNMQSDQAVAAANAFWKQPGELNVGGVPWWVWAGGALAALLFLQRSR